MNLQKLKETINEKGIKHIHLANKLNISNQLFNYKLNNKRTFNINECNLLSKILNLSDKDIITIFFGDSVPYSAHRENSKLPTPSSPQPVLQMEDEMTDQEAMDYLFGRKKG